MTHADQDDPDGQDVSRPIAELASTVRYRQLPGDVIAAARRSLLDAVGVSLAASGRDADAAGFADLVVDEGGRADSTVLGLATRVPAAAAAFANGALAHAMDFEDSYDPAPVHPNAQTVPAVLALAERVGASGADVVAALAVGCDVTCRLARAVGDAMADRGWYPPPILGAVGAAAACANLLRFDVRRTLDALSLAISQATASGEVKHSPHSSVRAIRDAFAAHAAVRAVELAARGVAGFDRPLDGHAGFFATYTGGDWDRTTLLDGLGLTFAGPDVSFKPWPSCRGTHAFIGAALALRTAVATDDIESVELGGSAFNRMLAEPHEAKVRPATPIAAKFSLPFTVATAIVDGALGLDSFAPDALQRTDVLALADRIRYRVDDTIAAASAGRVTIRAGHGAAHTVTTTHALGSPTAPMDDDALVAKFLACAADAATPVVDPSALAARLLALDASDPWRAVVDQHLM